MVDVVQSPPVKDRHLEIFKAASSLFLLADAELVHSLSASNAAFYLWLLWKVASHLTGF